MNNSRIYAIAEGCDHDNPENLHYIPIKFQIPDVKIIVTSENAPRLVQYGCFNPLSDNASLSRIYLSEGTDSQWEFSDPNCPNNPRWLHWAFEMPRSIWTKDGRIFVNEAHFKEGFGYYLEGIRNRVIDAIEVFRGYKSVEQMLERRIL